MGKLVRTPRQLMIGFVAVVNTLSGIIGALLWSLFLSKGSDLHPSATPFVPLVTTILVAIPLSALVSKPTARPFWDLIKATKAISKGDYSVRVEEKGEGEILELLRSFNQITAELGSTELMRNDFINTFSHEFKTPIVSIRGFAKRLRQNGLSEQQRRDYLDYIVSESERLADISSNILLLAKYENQQIVAERRIYELDEQIRRCILRLESQWEAEEMAFDISLETLHYDGNEEMLDHVWLNLIGNAIKFSHHGGTIHISATRRRDHIEVCIRDEGIGMNRQTMEHIFDKFYQGDAARASAGNGLGLPLVRRIIDLCGGEISVESEEGAGTAFHVSLPCES